MKIEEILKYKSGFYLAILDDEFKTMNGKLTYFSGAYHPILLSINRLHGVQFNLVGLNRAGICFNSFGMKTIEQIKSIICQLDRDDVAIFCRI